MASERGKCNICKAKLTLRGHRYKSTKFCSAKCRVQFYSKRENIKARDAALDEIFHEFFADLKKNPRKKMEIGRLPHLGQSVFKDLQG